MKDYKNTLNMPTTEFEMKANLNQKEPKIQENWILDKVEKKLLQRNKTSKKSFILHDGPPYANGNIHLGHALNKVIKDFILRYKSMNNFYCRFIPGWDTHGLPIEQELNKLGINNKPGLSVFEKRKNCKNFAIEKVYVQQDQFRRLGLLSELDDIYLTCDLDYEIEQLKIFAKMVNKKLIYQDLKPVYWSWSSQTALADAEIIYDNVESDSIYVSFLVNENNDFVHKNDRLLIWTTTPWTLPSNLAIAVNPKSEYVRVKVGNQFFILMNSVLEKIAFKLNWENYVVVSSFLGKKLENIKYSHIFYNRKSPVICDAYVSESDGTGLVHNAPGFGHEDYLACKKYGIKVFCPIDAFGKFTSEVKDKELENKFYIETNPIIIERIKKSDLLELSEKIVHSAAHDWRTKKPVIYRSTKQWFVDISKIKSNILKELSKVKSIDKVVIARMKEMINNRTEWCISRQRYWGVPIPIIYDKDEKPILDSKLINHIIDQLSDEGTNIWFKEDAKYFLSNDYNKSKKYLKEEDIMDVWFDSGSSYNVLIKNKLSYPADLYFEGKDQFRGWFNSSLITSVAVNNKAPYKTLLTHGFVLDENGNKMSKSLGNVIDPIKVCNEFGADVLRIWIASCDYADDVKISQSILNQSSEIYRRLRNTLFRFILGNIQDFDVKNLRKAKYNDADLFVLYTLSTNLKEITECYEKYNFKDVIRIVNNHIVSLSSWYFDYVKDSLYCDEKNSERRITIQSVLYLIIENYIKVLAPIIPHTCEEAYAFLNKKNKEKSVHFEEWKLYKLPSSNKIDIIKWNNFFSLKDLIYSEVEKARTNKVISNISEAFVSISSTSKLPFSKESMQQYLGIAKIELLPKTKGTDSVKIKNSKFLRCDRCWNNFEKLSKAVGENICNRCYSVLYNKK